MSSMNTSSQEPELELTTASDLQEHQKIRTHLPLQEWLGRLSNLTDQAKAAESAAPLAARTTDRDLTRDVFFQLGNRCVTWQALSSFEEFQKAYARRHQELGGSFADEPDAAVVAEMIKEEKEKRDKQDKELGEKKKKRERELKKQRSGSSWSLAGLLGRRGSKESSG